MKNFQELTLPSQLQKALAEMKFETPTPVQAQAIPHALKGRDVLACAQTGTGKTAAFSIPMITRLIENKGSTALVLVPTRELATQVAEVVRQLTSHLPAIRTVTLIGGMGMQPQTRALRQGYTVIVATPGRLLDHLDNRTATLSKLSILTLDEADRMLDMGFAPQLRRIFQHLPKSYQTLLFSATLPPNILKISAEILENPEQITIGRVSEAAPAIDQKIVSCDGAKKNEAVLNEINERKGSILIFARTKARTDRLQRYLEKFGVAVARIHGGRSQGQRNKALDEFRDETTRVLVATDIAARGLDIDHVAHVINYDLPMVAEDYVHRIGRTGRAGRTGEAISLISHEERPLWREIQKLLDKRSKGAAAPIQSVTLGKTVLNEESDEDEQPASQPRGRDHARKPQARRPEPRAAGGRPSQAPQRPSRDQAPRPARGDQAQKPHARKPIQAFSSGQPEQRQNRDVQSRRPAPAVRAQSAQKRTFGGAVQVEEREPKQQAHDHQPFSPEKKFPEKKPARQPFFKGARR